LYDHCKSYRTPSFSWRFLPLVVLVVGAAVIAEQQQLQ